jgi:hypothetical protein
MTESDLRCLHVYTFQQESGGGRTPKVVEADCRQSSGVCCWQPHALSPMCIVEWVTPRCDEHKIRFVGCSRTASSKVSLEKFQKSHWGTEDPSSGCRLWRR